MEKAFALNIFRYFGNSWLFEYLKVASLSILLVWAFIADHQMALGNIAIAFSFFFILVNVLYNRKWIYAFNPKLLTGFVIITLVYLTGNLIHFQSWKILISEMRNNILWFILPVLFCFIPFKNPKNDYVLIFVYLFTLLVITAISLNNYYGFFLTDEKKQMYNAFNHTTLHQIFIPIDIQHHMLAICLCIAFILSLNLIINCKPGRLILTMILITMAFEAIAIYIIKARIGILILFISMLFYIIYVLKNKFYFAPVVLSAFLILAGLFYGFLKYNHEFSYRFYKSVEDLNYIKNTNIRDIKPLENISTRIVAIKNTSEILSENIWRGVSLHAYQETLNHYFDKIGYKKYSERTYPANQFIKYLIALGLPLTMLFMAAFIFPLFIKEESSPMKLMLYIILFCYLNSEAPLDSTMSMRYFIITLAFIFRLDHHIIHTKTINAIH